MKQIYYSAFFYENYTTEKEMVSLFVFQFQFYFSLKWFVWPSPPVLSFGED